MIYQATDIKAISDSLMRWMESSEFAGWDPHDGLNSPFLRPLSNINRWLGVAALQVVKKSKINYLLNKV